MVRRADIQERKWRSHSHHALAEVVEADDEGHAASLARSEERGTRPSAHSPSNQDPLENLLSMIRQNGGNRSQPSASDFVPGLKTALCNLVTTRGGNC